MRHLGTLDGCITDDYLKVYNILAKSGIGINNYFTYGY